jgi:pSer/pThr/pTyr-binding forkhead associated (FHA) protein
VEREPERPPSSTAPPGEGARGRADHVDAAVPAAVVVIREGFDVGRTYPLTSRANTLGRGTACEICLPDKTVSRRHCQISWGGIAYVLQDLNSSNGTFLNGEQIQEAFLHDGDMLQVGDVMVQFWLGR